MAANRLGALVVVALLGALAALGVARLVGWTGGSGTKTVVVEARRAAPATALPAAVRSPAKPLPGNSFEPARIYRERSPGVVTIFSYFGNPDSPDAQAAQGSGFVVSPKGYILTNSHVVTNAGEGNPVHAANALYVEFSDLDRVPARIVGWDVYDDVGLIKVDPTDHALSPVPLGRSANVVVGEPVAAIGSPLGNENSLAVGIVSAIHRSIQALTAERYNLVDAIQTDAPITHGNSGGPLFDARGRVIGINAQIRSSSGSGNDIGIGFAVPIDSARRSLDQLLKAGHVDYAFVGIRTASLTPTLARKLGYKVRRGAAVELVEPNSPASRAGMKAGRDTQILGFQFPSGGDVIVAIGGHAVDSADDLVRIVSTELRPGEVATFTVYRDGVHRRTVAVTLGKRVARPASG